MAKLTPKDFLITYYPYAFKVEVEENIPALAIITRAAIEIGYDPEKAPGNNFFGIKDTDGINGNEQLVDTYEDMKTPLAKFPVIKSVKQLTATVWRYFIKDYFRKYATPYDSFKGFAQFLKQNSRYSTCLSIKDPVLFSTCICKQGYATDINAVKLAEDVSKMFVVLYNANQNKLQSHVTINIPPIDNSIKGNQS